MEKSTQMDLMATVEEEERAVEPYGLLEGTLKGMVILLSREVQGALDPNAAPDIAVIIGTTTVAGVVADILVTSPPITSGGTSSGTGMFLGVHQGAGVLVAEDLDGYAHTISTVADTEHFRRNKENAHVMQGTLG